MRKGSAKFGTLIDSMNSLSFNFQTTLKEREHEAAESIGAKPESGK